MNFTVEQGLYTINKNSSAYRLLTIEKPASLLFVGFPW